MTSKYDLTTGKVRFRKVECAKPFIQIFREMTRAEGHILYMVKGATTGTMSAIEWDAMARTEEDARSQPGSS